MYYGKVEICGVNTAKLPVLTEKEKTALLRAARAGDQQARQRMIQGNMRLVLSVVLKFVGRGESMDDLNVRFSTYGVPMIVGEIRRFLRDNNAVRVSRSVRDIAYKAMQAKEQLQKELGREPHMDEIAHKVQLPTSTVTLALESVVDPVSLYEPVYSDEGDTIYVMDQLGDSGGEDSWISGIMFKDTVQALSEREKKIMALRYLSGKTQVEVAKEIGISQAQVSRLEKNALGRIKGKL